MSTMDDNNDLITTACGYCMNRNVMVHFNQCDFNAGITLQQLSEYVEMLKATKGVQMLREDAEEHIPSKDSNEHNAMTN